MCLLLWGTMKEKLNENELRQENVAQYELAQLLFPNLDEKEAFTAYTSHKNKDGEGPSAQFRRILEENPDLKKRIDAGDDSAIKEIAGMIEL